MRILAKLFLTAILTLISALCTLSTAQSADDFGSYWTKRIAEAERLERKYSDEARKRDIPHLGTIYNEVDVNKHTCAILARAIGKHDLVAQLEIWTEPKLYPNMPWQEAEKVRIFAQSMSNFVYTAKNLLKVSQGERLTLWNLQCVGKFGIPKSAAVDTNGIKTTFRVDRKTLFVIGNIEKGFGESIARAIAENPNIDTVAFGSAGGSLADAMKAGSMIRALGLHTTLWSNCYSACTIAFLGGVERALWSPYPDLGFHQASIYGEDISPGSPVYLAVAKYAASMGANPRFLLSAMFAASSNDIYVPGINALCEQDVVTWVQRVCDGAGRRYQ